jgi:clostripain
MDDSAEEAYSAENLDVIVLQDNYSGPACLWHIDENHNKIPLKEMGEVNMGDYQTLKEFINYSKNHYPAERYLVSMYDHGGGWKGACRDDTDNSDHLTMDEMQKAFTETGGIDIICFTAPCLMGAVESAYELRNCVDVYIGSEELSGFVYWFDVIDDICDLLNEKISLSNAEIGKKIIQLIDENLDSSEIKEYWRTWETVTMSAIDSSAMDNVSKYVDKLAKDLLYKINEKRFSRFRIKIIHYLTQSFAKFREMEFTSSTLDLYDFAKKCSLFFAFDRTINLNAKNLMKSIDEAVIANINGIKYPRAHGLTIYFPLFKILYYSDYTGSDLDFANDTYWDEFLESYLKFK